MHLLRVLDPSALAPTLRAAAHSATEYTAAMDAATAAVNDYLEQHARRVVACDLAATVELREGAPVESLLAGIQPGDLVVISSHGHGGIRRWMLGSVAEKIVRFGAAPVMIVRPGEPVPA
jgi:nucleotide-binding universal stress UspA family protein